MARRPRMVVPGGVYHVYNRVSSGEPVFLDDEAALELIELIREVRQRDGWRVLAWCVMSNHYHLVVRAGEVPLWRGLHRVQNLFSRRYNRRCGRTGPVWQSRYKAKVIEDERHLGQVILYVHLNPARAGVAAKDGLYEYSGHGELLGKTAWDVTDVDQALLCFAETRQAALRQYRAAFRSALSPRREDQPTEATAVEEAAGEQLWYDAAVPYVDELGRSTAEERPHVPAEEFVEAAAGLLGVAPELLTSRSRNRKAARARRMAVLLAVERWGYRGRDLAQALGRTPDVVSWMVGRAVKDRLEDPGLQQALDDLDRGLIRSLSRTL